MRKVFSIMNFVVYLIAINVHILTFNLIEQTYSRLILWWAYFITSSYLALDVYNEWESKRHKLIGVITICSMGINSLLFILYYQFGMDDYKTKFALFNGSILAVSLMILLSGLRHGIFKQSFNDGE